MATDEIHQGRWLSPDPAGLGAVDLSNPQSWNAYAYVLNNPATNTDPSGLYCVQASNGSWFDDGNGGESCADVEKNNQAEEENPSTTVRGKAGNVAEAVGANIGIGITNLLTSNVNAFYSALGAGQYSPNLPSIPSGSGIAANIGAIAPLVGMALVGPGEGAEAAAEDVLASELGRPAWAKTPGGFLKWLEQYFQETGTQLTSKQADALVDECRRLHIEIRLDPPQGDWGVHFNVGKQGFHVEVPPSYDNPSVPKGRNF